MVNGFTPAADRPLCHHLEFVFCSHSLREEIARLSLLSLRSQATAICET
jgi:hypothetical protein